MKFKHTLSIITICTAFVSCQNMGSWSSPEDFKEYRFKPKVGEHFISIKDDLSDGFDYEKDTVKLGRTGFVAGSAYLYQSKNGMSTMENISQSKKLCYEISVREYSKDGSFVADNLYIPLDYIDSVSFDKPINNIIKYSEDRSSVLYKFGSKEFTYILHQPNKSH